jgi:translation elongation factor EF-G
MKDSLALWPEGKPNENSRILASPITVVGEWTHAGKSEFAKVQITLHPSAAFEVVDEIAEKKELESLNVGWPDSFVFGLLEELMNAKGDPLRNVRVTLEHAWYHEVDSSVSAFRKAGRDAGRKIIQAADENRSLN